MERTVVFDSYWRFAAERLGIYLRRLSDPSGPWTDDPVLRAYRFTNSYRVADRVSQYLIREVQYRADRSQAPAELFFRTMLFKLFNRIETWETLERELGPMSWQSADLNEMLRVLDDMMRRGATVYSAAYIMASPKLGSARKHGNHLKLLATMMDEGLPAKVERAGGLSEIFELLRPFPGLGSFLAFQYAIDLNYSSMLNFDEASFVVAGPGALDGIAKCFASTGGQDAETIIHTMVDEQESHFSRLGLDFAGLFGRRLQPIDCQNLFCEISKYSRVAHPEIGGSSGRTRIKQSFSGEALLAQPVFPPRWQLQVPDYSSISYVPRQGALL